MKSAFLHIRRCLLLGVVLWAGVMPVVAATGPSGGEITITSRSGQFVVAGRPFSKLLPESRQAEMAATRLVDFDPNLAAASCERVRVALNRRLRIDDEWRGKCRGSLGDHGLCTGHAPTTVPRSEYGPA